MPNKELRRLRRSELIDIIYQLKISEQELKKQVFELQTKLNEREMKIQEAGSLAEATLSLHEVFRTAQDAADLYTQEVMRRCDEMEKERMELLEQAHMEADKLMETAEQQRNAILKKCKEMQLELRKMLAKFQEVRSHMPNDKNFEGYLE